MGIEPNDSVAVAWVSSYRPQTPISDIPMLERRSGSDKYLHRKRLKLLSLDGIPCLTETLCNSTPAPDGRVEAGIFQSNGSANVEEPKDSLDVQAIAPMNLTPKNLPAGMFVVLIVKASPERSFVRVISGLRNVAPPTALEVKARPGRGLATFPS